MTFDWNVAGGEAALMEHLAFEQQRSRAVAYPVVTTAAGAQTPAQAVTSSTLAAMSQQNRQSLSLSPASSWLPLDMTPATTTSASVGSSSPEEQQAPSPGYHSSASSPLQHQPSPYQTAAHPNPSLITDWPLPQQHVHHAHQAHHELSHFIQDSSLITFNPLMPTFQPAPLEYMPATTAGLPGPMPAFSNMSPVDDATHSPAHPAAASAIPWGMGMANWQDFEAAIAAHHPDGLPRVGSLGSHSPTGTYLEVLSLNSGSDNGWTGVDVFPNYDQYQQTQQQQSHNAAIFNPGQTLHLRTNSDSSHSDGNSLESSGYEEIPFPYSPFSPNSDTCLDSAGGHRRCCPGDHAHSRQHASPELISPVGSVGPITIKAAPASGKGTSGSGSGSTSSSPPNRRNSGGPRKSPIAKATKAVSRRSPTGDSKKDGAGEKKVGRRRGPLRPDQRKQASEIRKLRACLRCKFLKKTCDTGEPCNGCQPAHARLWQVPCTRIDIKDIGFFMKDWKADYERHLGRGVSVFNVKGFAPKETLMWITHGYGFCLPVTVREVYVADESCFQLDWVESSLTDQEPINFEIRTERLDVGHEGVNMEALNEYLDKHVDEGFERFIDDHFEGTPFITEVFKTAYRFYQKSRLPVIRKALKLVVAYNLTLHITMIESSPVEQQIDGQIDDEDSKYFGKTVAPVMINFQIKCAMADMWRDLQKDILEELSSLYSSVYSGERLKNWPTIFMLASILLAVWEEMQFDCHYRVPDPVAVNKFCTDMEQTPVGVIVGLFHAISQKLPSFTEWDTRRHGQLLQNNPAVCEAMTEVRQHVIKHEAYLRTRQDCKFDRYDFDSLSNKFLSKLVIRAN